MLLTSLIYVVFAFLLSYFGVEWLRQQLVHRAILDIPNQRSSHSIPTPKGGGLLIAGLTLAGLAVWLVTSSEATSMLVVYLLTGTAIAVLGWWDDLKPLPALVRLGLQALCGSAFLVFGLGWELILFPGWGEAPLNLGLIGLPLTLIWIVGLTNAYNFMDGLDGIAGGQGLVAGFGWFSVGWFIGEPLFMIWGGLLMGATAGFLFHNWHPAKIFMGDVGSTFLGFSLAVIPLFWSSELGAGSPEPAGFLISAILVWPFLFDAGLTFTRRLLKGENVLEAHRAHLYQRLTRLNFKHSQVAALYIVLGLLGYPLVYFLLQSNPNQLQPFLFWGTLLHLTLGLFTFVTQRESALGLRGEWFSIIRNRHLFLLDILLISASTYISFLLRLEDITLGNYVSSFITLTAILLLILPLIFVRLKVYSRYWPFASISDLMQVVVGLLFGMILAVVTADLLLISQNRPTIPRSVPLIFVLVTTAMLTTPRLLLRLIGQARPNQFPLPDKVKRVLIVGAGHTGLNLLREIQLNPRANLSVVGMIDDAPSKQEVWILGVPVLGRSDDIPDIAVQFQIDEIFVAIPSAPGQVLRRILHLCEQVGTQVKVVPSIYERLNGGASYGQLREVNIEDLLRREPVSNAAEMSAVHQQVKGKRVLVTGAGGSIGSELCRQILPGQPAQIILLGHGENSIFDIFHELKGLAASLEIDREVTITPKIADIRMPERIDTIFAEYQPEIVYHAAAHKHVPLMEYNPSEAVTNNVLGTQNVLNAAVAYDTDRFVLISSDKAVNPTNIMGASKRAAEMLVHQAAKRSGKPYVAVRFGNVLGSRGSVIHTFKRQIAQGGPITVTHPDVKRYFMLIPEAVQLVLQAGVLGKGSEVFVLDMSEPIKIVDLARDLIELSGLRVGEDIDIVFSGLRPGEKLFEELFISEELYQRTRHSKIFVAPNAGTFVPANLRRHISRMGQIAESGHEGHIYKAFKQLIPEFNPEQKVLVDTDELPMAGD